MDLRDPLTFEGKTLVDRDGEKIGRIDDLFVDHQTGEPEWLLVDTGLFGRDTIVPVGGAEPVDDETIRVPHGKDRVKDAPPVEADEELSMDAEQELYTYYGIDYSEERSGTILPSAGASTGAEVRPGTHGIEERPREVVRLKKRTVTEPVQRTIPVEREEVYFEREPESQEDGERHRGANMGDEVHEEVLADDELVVDERVEEFDLDRERRDEAA
jgi:hypothetical protein